MRMERAESEALRVEREAEAEGLAQEQVNALLFYHIFGVSIFSAWKGNITVLWKT